MNRELISKALSQIDDEYIAESASYRGGKRAMPPERKDKMGKHISEEKRRVSVTPRRTLSIILAACLLLALGVTAYATNLFGIRELSKTAKYELPDEAEGYIEPQSAAADSGEGEWSAQITESLCDESTVMVTLTVSGGDKYLLVPTDALTDDPVSSLGIEGDMTLAEYAAQQNRELLWINAGIKSADGGDGISQRSMRFERISDGEAAILVEAGKTAGATDAVCYVIAKTSDAKTQDDFQRVELPVTLNAAPTEEVLSYVPVSSDAVCGIIIDELTITKTPLGLTLTASGTTTDDYDQNELMAMNVEGLDFKTGSVGDEEGVFKAEFTGGTGTPGDTVLVYFRNWDKERIGEIEMKLKN